jgi:hypothetical protein
MAVKSFNREQPFSLDCSRWQTADGLMLSKALSEKSKSKRLFILTFYDWPQSMEKGGVHLKQVESLLSLVEDDDYVLYIGSMVETTSARSTYAEVKRLATELVVADGKNAMRLGMLETTEGTGLAQTVKNIHKRLGFFPILFPFAKLTFNSENDIIHGLSDLLKGTQSGGTAYNCPGTKISFEHWCKSTAPSLNFVRVPMLLSRVSVAAFLLSTWFLRDPGLSKIRENLKGLQAFARQG